MPDTGATPSAVGTGTSDALSAYPKILRAMERRAKTPADAADAVQHAYLCFFDRPSASDPLTDPASTDPASDPSSDPATENVAGWLYRVARRYLSAMAMHAGVTGRYLRKGQRTTPQTHLDDALVLIEDALGAAETAPKRTQAKNLNPSWIRKKRTQGWSWRKIAAFCHANITTVRNALRGVKIRTTRVNNGHPKIPEEIKFEIRQMRSAGVLTHVIAKKYHLNPATIRRIVKELRK